MLTLIFKNPHNNHTVLNPLIKAHRLVSLISGVVQHSTCRPERQILKISADEIAHHIFVVAKVSPGA
jgi:hypothetical protein